MEGENLPASYGREREGNCHRALQRSPPPPPISLLRASPPELLLEPPHGGPVDPPLFGPAVGTGGSRQLLRQRGPESGPSLACQPEPRQPKRRTAGPKLPTARAAPPSPLLSRRASRLQSPVFNRLRPAPEVSVGGRGKLRPPPRGVGGKRKQWQAEQ